MKVAGLLALAVAIVALPIIGGCGGHDGQVPPAAGPGPLGATFIGGLNPTTGNPSCALTCHSAESTGFAQTAHGKNFHDPASTAYKMDLITALGGACQPCHTVGYGEPGGWVSQTATPQMANIGCEKCHGPGSMHAGAPSAADIYTVPTASQSCWDCHGPGYKLFRNGAPTPTTDASLAGSAPGKVAAHHGQTPMLLGYLGYNRGQVAGPHAQINNTCVTCHLNHDSGDWHSATALKPDFQACAPCHGSAAAAQTLFASFDGEITKDLIAIGGETSPGSGEPDESGKGGKLAAYATLHGINVATNTNPNDPYVKNYKAAKWDFTLIAGGYAVHNPTFARQMVTDISGLLSN